MSIQEQDMQLVAASVLEEAKKCGATAAEVSLSKGKGLSVDVRMGEVETLEYHRDQGLGITVYVGNKKGVASTGDLSKQAIQDTVEAACRIAKYTSEDKCAGLADAELMATEIPDLDLYHPWDISAEEAIELAKNCEQAARDVSPLITNADGTGVSTYEGNRIYANTHGFMGQNQGTRHSLSCTMVAEDDGAMQRDYWYTVSRLSKELEDAESVGRKASENALKRLHGRQIKTTKAPALYVPSLAGGFVGHFTSAISGGALYRKASFLLDSLGEKVFPEFVHLHEKPFIPQALGSASYDSEGVALREKNLIHNGVIESYLLGSYSARQLGMQTTANAGGTHNLILESTGESYEDLLQKMGTGFLVTELIGSSVNGMTGDYSRGASGFWVENGEIQFPVEEVTVAGNLRDMFNNIIAVGTDVDYRGSTRTGSILLEEVTIAGQ
ncbi:MAG: TldE protein, part of TldE/TldD proteolytic complex [uncultured Thiotrichaceae bacterium]|uniref:TldE protein, part of TldE/TldD proteolytic complex n=1 Tax=uncultured Thiotrichaceae bacterium TaxID=298394 RepID=A0A6S6RZC3_9GAMM|nr:MAG: TldE protein, part of TldE/TldD proteolytic complex [uncultured Thiotrichaceae bacterium]